jgi:hypothetical protein
MDREDTDITTELGATKVPLVSAEPQRPVRRTPLTRPPSRLPRGDFRSIDERLAAGRALRQRCPRGAHAKWRPSRKRDLLSQLRQSDAARLPWLVPVRHERMAESSFAFLRGTPFLMAYDLAHTPVSGARSQLCGDAHLGNFGLYASPERHLVFDLNDFDETLPGPFEWDVKRLAASCVVAARRNGLARAHARTGDAAVISGYLGGGSCFDEAVADFAVTYADQVDEDYARFLEAHAREATAGLVH